LSFSPPSGRIHISRCRRFGKFRSSLPAFTCAKGIDSCIKLPEKKMGVKSEEDYENVFIFARATEKA
jgi:hypothetical protein